MRYRGRRALVTGGLGFIGSNLALRLVEEGAEVTIVDSSIAGCGANPFNISPRRDQIRVVAGDIGEPETISGLIERSDVIFNLAGEISHIHSMQFPERDLQTNTVAQLRFLTECARRMAGIRVVYASTRQIYGVPRYLPIDEDHPIAPVDFNGIHKYATSMYHEMLSRNGQIDGIALRLTNVYGPRMAVDIPCQGFLSTFLRRLLLGQDLEVYGDGAQLRDPVHVDDVVEAFLLAGSAPRPASRAYNVGGPQALSLCTIAEIAARHCQGCQVRLRPFPEEIRAIDIGSYTTDSTRICRELGWGAKVHLEDGLAQTLAYYREYLPHYLDLGNPQPACRMPEHSNGRWRLTYAAV